MIGEAPLPFDVVILGLRSADPEELSVIQEIRAVGSGERSPAVIVIGYECTGAERDRCHRAGIETYIARPVDLGNLCEVVETITRIATPGGTETKDPTPDGRGLLARHVQKRNTPGRILVEFAVDEETGDMLTAVAPPIASQPDASPPVAAPPAASPPIASQPAASPPVASPPIASQPAASPPVAAPPVAAPPAAAGTEVPCAAAPLPALDLARLGATCRNEPALRAGIVASYLQRSRDALARIEQAVARTDAATVEAEIQRLTMMATGIGALSSSGIYLRMAGAVRSGSLGGARELVARAYAELGRAEELAAA